MATVDRLYRYVGYCPLPIFWDTSNMPDTFGVAYARGTKNNREKSALATHLKM